MLNWIITRQLNALERRLGTSVDYLRFLARTSRSAYFKFMAFVPLAAHHGKTPRRMLFAARLLATQREDCGTCVQIVIDQAIRDGIEVETIQALLDNNHSQLDPATRLAVEFTLAVLDNSGDQERLRNELQSDAGAEAVVDLSLAIASARVFPTLKRGLGYAISCQKVGPRVPRLKETVGR